jgi:5-formyltetrahydrofolate cyclo-ligase
MNSGELKRAKRDVRRRVLAARDALEPAVRAAAGGAVAARFIGLAEVRHARTVMAFWSFGSELPTEPVLRALDERGITIALPAIVEGDLEPRAYRPGDAVTPTSFGAFEPSNGRIVSPADIDVVATPAVAFDRAGRRVGYGGGFYDRFFPLLRADAHRVGLAFDAQVLPEGEELPAGHFDLRVHIVVTASEVIDCDRGAQERAAASPT